MLGYHPQVILAGRRINDGMGKYIAEQTDQADDRQRQLHQGRQGQRAGPDLQGKLRRPAQQQGRRHHHTSCRATASRCSCTTRRPTPTKRCTSTACELLAWDDLPRADAIVAAVAHRQYRDLGVEDIGRKLVNGGCFIDVKACFDAAALEAAGLRVWRL